MTDWGKLLLRENLLIFPCGCLEHIYSHNFSYLTIYNLSEFIQVLSF